MTVEDDQVAVPAGRGGSTDLINGPIGRTLIVFALPTLLSTVLQSASASVNAVWVGRFLGEGALAATANGNIVMFIALAFVFGFGMAATILIGQTFGRGDLERTRMVTGTTFGAFIPASVLVSAIGWFLADDLLSALGTPAEASALALIYLRVIFLGMPVMLTLTLATMALRGVGDARTPLIFMAMTVILDSGINPLLIAGIGPFPEMGIAGAATATLIANIITLPVMVLYLYKIGSPLALPRSAFATFKPDPTLLRTIVAKGVPIGLQMIVISTAALSILRLVNAEGVDTAAAYSVVQQLWAYVQMPAMAISGAVSAMAAQNIGAGRWDRVNAITRSGALLVLAVTGFIALVLWIADGPVLSLFFGADSPATPIAERIVLLATWGFLALAAALVLVGTVRANGAVIAPLIILFLAMYPARLGFATLLRPYLGVDAIWLSFPAGMIAMLILAALYYRFGHWREMELDPAERPEAHECNTHARATREAAGAATAA